MENWHLGVWGAQHQRWKHGDTRQEDAEAEAGCEGRVVPDDFAVLAGDVELENIPAFDTLNELQWDLRGGGVRDGVRAPT